MSLRQGGIHSDGFLILFSRLLASALKVIAKGQLETNVTAFGISGFGLQQMIAGFFELAFFDQRNPQPQPCVHSIRL